MDKHHKKIRSSCKNTRSEIILDKKTKQRRRKCNYWWLQLKKNKET